jgi:hypothetical protein
VFGESCGTSLTHKMSLRCAVAVGSCAAGVALLATSVLLRSWNS